MEVHQIYRKLCFGAIPKDIVERIENNPHDKLTKLRAIQDLDNIFDSLYED